MKEDVLQLFSNRKVKDDYGIWHDIEDTRQVFCKVDSVSMTEFFNGGKTGLKPDKKFIIFPADYKDETELLYRGHRYSVYRTYEGTLDSLELYCERKAGTVEEPEE